ncbi:hypothetical protein VWZ88_06010 [Phaeobacter sp. JH20_36]|uniref:hypothetical protein n=1 Tax=Phaeobacter sp. JH20_12 TaxID=3112471 RepID=UPI003A8AA0C2
MLLLLSLGVAVGLYQVRQISNQLDLRTKLMQADPIAHFCQSLPQFSRSLCDATLENAPDTSQLSFEILLEAEVISLDDFESAADLDENAPVEVRRVKEKLDAVIARRFSDQSPASTSGATLLSEMAGWRCLNDAVKPPGSDSGTTTSVAEIDVKRGKVVAHLLADIPGGPDSYRTLSRSCSPAMSEARDLLSKAKDATLPKPTGQRLTSRSCIGAADVLLLLSEQTRAVAKPPESKQSEIGTLGYQSSSAGSQCVNNMNDRGKAKTFTETEFLKTQNNVTRLSEFVMAQMFETAEVKAALTTLRMWRGPEHIGIITLTLLVFLVTLARVGTLIGTFLNEDVARFQEAPPGPAQPKTRNRLLLQKTGARLHGGGTEAWAAQRELDEGRRYQRWALASIPAIGFIGTVRGILNALPEAREVVFASSTLGRADAIGTLAGELGLSFSTTLFALLASLGLSFVLLVASRTEATMLRLLSEEKVPAAPEGGQPSEG